MRGYYNRGVENNPFNFSIRSAGYLGTTKSNFFFPICSVFAGFFGH